MTTLGQRQQSVNTILHAVDKEGQPYQKVKAVPEAVEAGDEAGPGKESNDRSTISIVAWNS